MLVLLPSLFLGAVLCLNTGCATAALLGAGMALDAMVFKSMNQKRAARMAQSSEQKAEAKVQAEIKKDNEALFAAVEKGDHEKVKKLLTTTGVLIDARDENGETALMKATRKRFMLVVRVLLEHGADVNAADGQGRTALSIAKQAEDTAMVSALLDAGAREQTQPIPSTP